MPSPNLWPKYSPQFSGAWKCVSFELHSVSSPDPSPTTLLAKPHGEEPLGRVQLSAKGYLSAHVASPQALTEAAATFKAAAGEAAADGEKKMTWQASSDADVAKLAREMSMYCGPFELFEGQVDDEGVEGQGEGGLWWQTRVEVSTDPMRMGGLERRRVRFEVLEGGRMVMTLRPFGDMMVMEDGTHAKGVLKWEKIE